MQQKSECNRLSDAVLERGGPLLKRASPRPDINISFATLCVGTEIYDISTFNKDSLRDTLNYVLLSSSISARDPRAGARTSSISSRSTFSEVVFPMSLLVNQCCRVFHLLYRSSGQILQQIPGNSTGSSHVGFGHSSFMFLHCTFATILCFLITWKFKKKMYRSVNFLWC